MFKKIFKNFTMGIMGIIIGTLLLLLVFGANFVLVGGFTWVVLWIFGVSNMFVWSKVFWVWLIILAWKLITNIRIRSE